MWPGSLLVLWLLLIPACLALDYYKVLDVSRDADDRTIKKQYRKLSRKYHPDKNSDAEAEQRFMEIGQAFEVLSDEELRRAYDRGGEEAVRRHQQGGGEGHGSPFDLFSHFFGGGGRRQGGGGGVRKGPNMVTEVVVDLRDIFTGKSLDITLPAKRICSTCRGSGARSASDIVECPHCQGRGIVLMRHQLGPGMFTQVQQACGHCGGTGKHTKKACSKCRGQKVLQTNEELTVDIDRGLPEGTELLFEGEADESPDWQAGDVIVRVKAQDHAGGFSRKGSNLYYKLVLTVEEALLGFERKVKALDGHWLTLKRQGTTQPGEVEGIPDEGMPHYHGSGHGSLFVTYDVVMPSSLSGNLRAKLETAFGRTLASSHSEL